MKKHQCPICQKDLNQETTVGYTDYECVTVEHFFAKRLVNGELTKIKVRLGTDDNKLYLKVNFDEGMSEVWAHKNNVKRTNLDYTFTPDFSDIEKLRSKIKTYLIFS